MSSKYTDTVFLTQITVFLQEIARHETVCLGHFCSAFV